MNARGGVLSPTPHFIGKLLTWRLCQTRNTHARTHRWRGLLKSETTPHGQARREAAPTPSHEAHGPGRATHAPCTSLSRAIPVNSLPVQLHYKRRRQRGQKQAPHCSQAMLAFILHPTQHGHAGGHPEIISNAHPSGSGKNAPSLNHQMRIPCLGMPPRVRQSN